MTNRIVYTKAAAEAAGVAACKAQAIASVAHLVEDEMTLRYLVQSTQDAADEAANHWEAAQADANDAKFNEEEDYNQIVKLVDYAFQSAQEAEGAVLHIEGLYENLFG